MKQRRFAGAACMCALTLMLGLARAQDSKTNPTPVRQDSEPTGGALQNQPQPGKPQSDKIQTDKTQSDKTQESGGQKADETKGGSQDARLTAALTVRFTGLRGRKGVLRVVLVDKPEAWMSKKTPPLTRRDIALKDLDDTTALDPFVVTFDALAPGTYALSAYHDANGNNRLDTNFLGIPTERTGASNNPRPAMRAPRFNEAKFDLAADEKKTLTINLR